MNRRVLALGVIAIALCAWCSSGFIQMDEHFKVLEAATSRAGLVPDADAATQLDHTRSFLLPAVAIVVRRAMWAFGVRDPFELVAVLRALTGVLYILAVVRLARATRPWFQTAALWHVAYASALLLWFAPVVAVRFSSEGWSGPWFVIGLATMIDAARGPSKGQQFALAGAAMGVAFAARYQTVVLAVAAIAWLTFAARARPRAIALMVVGFGCVVGASLALDRWGYGVWRLTPWNYYYDQLVLGTLADHDTESAWRLVWGEIARMCLPIGVVVVSGVLVGWVRKPKSVLTCVMVAFVLFHLSFSHKEERFLNPLVPMLPFIACLGFDDFGPAIARWSRSKALRLAAASLIVVNIGAFAARLYVPLEPRITLQRAVWESGIQTLVVPGPTDPYVWFAFETFFYRRPGLKIVHAGPGASPLSAHAQPYLVALQYPDTGASMFESCPVLVQTWPLPVPEPWRSRIPWPFDASPEHDPYWWTLRRCAAT